MKATRPTETGFYDRHGIPICDGDLIRTEHYRHRRGRRLMHLYFRVGKIGDRWVVYGWNSPDSHQCQLSDCGISTAEVLAESCLHCDERGVIMTFNERKRLAKQEQRQ